MSNRWVISWLVIDYWRWSMSNRWVIEAQKFCGLSITHRWHRLVIDVIDYSSMTYKLLIDYYTAHDRHFSCSLVPFFFVCDSFICVRRICPCIWTSCWRCRDAIANHKYRWFSIVQFAKLNNLDVATVKGVVQQKWQKDTGEPKFHGKWVFWRTFWSLIWKHLFTFKLF